MNSTNEVTVNIAAHAPGTNVVTINLVTPDTGHSVSEVATNAASGATGLANTSWSLGEVFEHPVRALSYFWKSAFPDHPHLIHIVIILGLTFVAHLVVRFILSSSEKIINRAHERKNPLEFVTQQPKFITLSRLIISTVVFLIYALALYIIIALEFPNDNTLKTYLGSAAVIGLALSFGLQGLVQDVVTCITLILSDSLDVGDTVDLMNGVIGRVERIGLRFTKVINFYNQEIFVPNRNITNVSRFPHSGILAFADVQIPAKTDQAAVAQTIQNVSKGIWNQFGAIILAEPLFSKVHTTAGNWNYMRVEFKIWPGQNAIIETTFRSQMVNAMKTFDSAYADWQVVITYRAVET